MPVADRDTEDGTGQGQNRSDGQIDPPAMTTSVMPVATSRMSGSWFAMVRRVVAVKK